MTAYMPEQCEEKKLSGQDDIAFAFINIQKAAFRLMVRRVSNLGMTLQQFNILRILSQEGPLPMNRLGLELFVTPSNVTGMVDRLEEKGFVKRSESRNDRRKTEIQLTPKGGRLYHKVEAILRESFESSLKALTPEQQKTLSDLLGKLYDGIIKER